MRNYIKYIGIVVAIMKSTIAFGQAWTISGSIVDAQTGSSINNVDIYSESTDQLMASDHNGSFSLTLSNSDKVVLTLFKEGYNTFYTTVNSRIDTVLVIRMERLSIELTEIQLRAKKKEQFALKRLKDLEGTSLYAGKKNEVVVMELQSGNLANNNSRQIYAQVTGLNVYEGSDGGLQLSIGGRGLDPNRTSNFNTRQNEYDISADVLGYPENYYTPPAEAISEIQIVRGASSLQYGTQFGGLINFKLHDIPEYKPLEIRSRQTLGSFGLFNSFNYVGLTKGKFSINTSFGYKKGDGFRENSEFRSDNLFLSLKYRPTEKSSIKAEYTHFNYLAKQAGGLTDDQFIANPRQSTRSRNWFNVNWNLYNFRLDHEFTAKNKMSISLFGLSAARRSVGFRGNPVIQNENPITSLDEQDNEGNFILPRDLILGTFKNYGAEVKFLSKYQFQNKKSILLVGAKAYKANNLSVQGPGSLDTDADFSLASSFGDYPAQSDFKLPNTNFALFAENILYLNDQLSITPGARVEYIKTSSEGTYNQVVFDNAGNPIANNLLEENNSLSRSFALFGIGLSYKKNKKINLYANVSQNYRSVTFSDIRVVSPTFIVDPDISDEKGFTADLGFRGILDKKASYEINAFGILYDDRIGIILDDRANRLRKNIGSAWISGIESLISLNLGEFLEASSEYTVEAFANTSYTYSRYISSEENNVVGNRVEFIPSIIFKTGIGLGYKNLLFTSQLSYTSEQFTDVQNSLRDGLGGVRNGIIGKIPAYTVVDASLSYKFKSFKIETGINNLLNRAYFTRRATGYPGPGIIPSETRSFYLTVGYSI